MPELPEVELAIRRLRPAGGGREIAAFVAHHPTSRRALSAARARALVGRRIVALERRGKYQRFVLDDGASIIAHFRLDGDWHVAANDAPLARHARISLQFTDASRLSLLDPRALATITWHAHSEQLFTALGPEPFDDAFTAPAMRAAFARRTAAVKLVLLDQHVVAGIGNIYAAEALWHAAIDPRTPANAIGLARLVRLRDAVRHALQRGLDEPGRYYASTPDAATAASVHELMVYDREGESCRRCDGTVKRITQGARSTYFCPRCQKR